MGYLITDTQGNILLFAPPANKFDVFYKLSTTAEADVFMIEISQTLKNDVNVK